MRENICNQQGINLQNMQVAHSAQNQKKKKDPPKAIQLKKGQET